MKDPDRSFVIPKSESKLMVGQKRGSVEVGVKSEFGHKRVKMRDLESVFRAEGRMGKDTSNGAVNLAPLDLNDKVGIASNLFSDDIPACDEDINKLSSCGKQEIESEINFVKSRGFGFDLNTEDVSISVSNDTFYHYKSNEHAKLGDASECGSSCGSLEEKDPMRVWKEMKQNGFLSSPYGGVPMPKPHGRKSKHDEFKRKMELAKREQVDRLAKIAAPSGLLNELNPGIINHVRNRKQVHSIIEAVVRSEKHENSHAGSKQAVQTKKGMKEFTDRKDMETMKGSGMNRLGLCHEDGYLNTQSGSRQISRCPTNSELTGEDDDSSMVLRGVFGKTARLSYPIPDSEDDILALKLSSSTRTTTMASENMSCLSNEESGNLTSVTSLSVKAANVASQWLELLHQDIKGRLSALERSRKRVQAVIHMELREFSFNQENDSYVRKTSATDFSDLATAKEHRARWNALFDQMDRALSEEQKQLESWLNQVKEMQLHCERGLFQYSATHGLQPLDTLESDCRLEKTENSERDLAVSAAAASIYSTCNFLQSMENLPCF